MFPGKEFRSTASMELQRVDIAGEKRVAWKKAMRAARCGSGHKTLTAWDGACADDKLIVACGSTACKKLFTVAPSLYRAFGDLVSSAIQSWLLAVQVPLSTSLPFFCYGAGGHVSKRGRHTIYCYRQSQAPSYF